MPTLNDTYDQSLVDYDVELSNMSQSDREKAILSIQDKDKIIEWRKRVGEEEANRISTKAAGRGTRVHTLCENYLNNEEDYARKTMPDSVAMFKSIQPFYLNRSNNFFYNPTNSKK
jgi:hypothetical protein